MNSPSSCAKYARVIRVQSREKLTPLPSAKIGRPTFSPNISRVPLSAQFAAAFISNFHGELKFQFNHLGSVLIRPLKFQMRSVPGTQRPRDKAGMLRPPFATAVPLPPPTPIEHRRCCHPPPLSRGVHLQFLAQIALEPHLITPRYLSNVSLPSQEGKFPNFFLPGITNSSLQFLLTDNFPSRGELFIVY